MKVAHRLGAFFKLFTYLIVFIGLWLSPADAQEAMGFAVDPTPLVITTTKGTATYELEIADTDIERAAGLMFRTDFPESRALLFEFGQTRPVSMWMKNTPLPLDMLFIDERGLLVGIAENTMPQSLDVISSSSPVHYVLEINAGQVAKHGFKTGDILAHPSIGR